MPSRVENIVRKGEIACHVFQNYISLVCQDAALCGNGLINLFESEGLTFSLYIFQVYKSVMIVDLREP